MLSRDGEFKAGRLHTGTDEVSLVSGDAPMLDTAAPTVTVDRALSHLLSYVDVDVTAVQNFYKSLPHEDKPDLETLHIHLSASNPVEETTETCTYGQFAGQGTRFLERVDRKTVPELPETVQPTIVIYLGGFVLTREESGKKEYKAFVGSRLTGEALSGMVSETAGHELAHLAQADPSDLRQPTLAERAKDRAQRLALSGLRRSISITPDLVVGFGAAVISEVTTQPTGSASMVVGAGAAGLSYLLNKGDRKKMRLETEFKNYKERDKERDAREHEEMVTEEICTIKLLDEVILPSGYSVEDFVKITDSKFAFAVARQKHKELSQTPRGGNPSEIRKEASRSELKAAFKKLKPVPLKPGIGRMR